ncbi:hypothetical protein [Planomonospora sp. ID82291]|uniref:hypothetical protein n=1 Tax=Planomonospora sp. ID82291 TaxID=2738136 RepID=UPI0018C38447|nr:hypothetical protein [Planomonospora sp. ID82291]MBG0819067.1 hypothetical protein [Planomonospora sp. ID82291]
MPENTEQLRTYVTGVADQLAAAMADDDKTATVEILTKVAAEHSALGEVLAEEVVRHGIRGAIERGR